MIAIVVLAVVAVLLLACLLLLSRRRLVRANQPGDTWSSGNASSSSDTWSSGNASSSGNSWSSGSTWPSSTASSDPVTAPDDQNPDEPWPMLPAYASPSGGNHQPGWQPYVPRTQRRSGRTWQLAVAALAAAAVVGFVGFRLYVSFRAPSHPSALAPLSIAPPSPTPVTTAHGIAGLLEQDALRTTDFNPGNTLKLGHKGDQVHGQPSLVNCGFHFTSERHRVVRREYELHDVVGTYRGLTNDLVAYDKASHAALALRQWRQATARCTHHAVAIKLGRRLPKAKERALSAVVHEPVLPNKQNIVTLESITGKNELFLTAILQRRGRILDVLYVVNTTRPDATELAAELHLAVVTGLRLHGQS